MATEEIKEKIVETSLQMFGSRGCRGVTMDDIAQAMHISKRTLYEYFECKEELLGECLRLVHNRMYEEYCRAMGRVEEPLLVVMYILRTNTLSVHRYHRLIEEAKRYYPEIHNLYFIQHTDAMRAMIRKSMDYARNQGYLHEDVDTDVAVEFFWNIIHQHHHPYMDDFEAYKRRLNHITFTYLRGMMNIETLTRYEQMENGFQAMVEKMKDMEQKQ